MEVVEFERGTRWMCESCGLGALIDSRVDSLDDAQDLLDVVIVITEGLQ